MSKQLDPESYVIARKRKKYKFALFHNNPLCFEVEQWHDQAVPDSMELGAGTGLFGVALAQAQPDTQVLAVDVKADRLQTGARYATELGLQNIRFLRARADQLAGVIPPHSLTSIWVTFPDPFPKNRSAKHRLTHPYYLALYSQLLSPGGALYFKTDAKQLFEWSLERLVENQWKIRELSFDLHESDLPDGYKYKTTYEARFTAEGLPTHFVKAAPPVD